MNTTAAKATTPTTAYSRAAFDGTLYSAADFRELDINNRLAVVIWREQLLALAVDEAITIEAARRLPDTYLVEPRPDRYEWLLDLDGQLDDILDTAEPTGSVAGSVQFYKAIHAAQRKIMRDAAHTQANVERILRTLAA